MQGKTVLLVEDEAAIVDVVRRYLERDGYRVMVASDGQRAVDEFQRLRPDLVLLDLMLPGLDGWEVCRRIRQDGSTPVIMLTARDEEADKLIGLELGADDYITKPFSPREVVARVRAVLRRARGAEAGPGDIVRVHDPEIDPARGGAFPPRARLHASAVTGPGAGLRLRRVRTHDRRAHQEHPAEAGARPEEAALHPHRAPRGASPRRGRPRVACAGAWSWLWWWRA